jgi:hypothetical protein
LLLVVSLHFDPGWWPYHNCVCHCIELKGYMSDHTQ